MMVIHKWMLEENRFNKNTVRQWYQSARQKSWRKPFRQHLQTGFMKRKTQEEIAGSSLTRQSQIKQLSKDCKDMLRKKLKEIEAYNASRLNTATKEQEEGKPSTIKRKKKARCFICRKRGHVFWKCPNKKKDINDEVQTENNKLGKTISVRNEEGLKYPEKVHVKTDYMIEGTDFSNWNSIWYVSHAYKKHMCPTKSLFKKLRTRLGVEGTQHEEKFIFSHGVGEAMVETNEKSLVISCVLYTPETTLNVLSIDQLKDQGFVVVYVEIWQQHLIKMTAARQQQDTTKQR